MDVLPDEARGSPRLRMSCTYNKKGVCSQHGQGIKKFKPSHEMVVGPRGGLVKKYVKKYYWVCDLDLMGDVKLKQPRLNLMMTQNDRRGGDGGQQTLGGGIGVSSTSKVGQNKSCVQVAGSQERKEVD